MQIVINPDELMKLPNKMLVDMLIDRDSKIRELENRLRQDRELTRKEAAEELNLSIYTIDKYMAQGRIKAVKTIPGKQQSAVRIPYSEILAYKQSRHGE